MGGGGGDETKQYAFQVQADFQQLRLCSNSGGKLCPVKTGYIPQGKQLGARLWPLVGIDNSDVDAKLSASEEFQLD